MNFVIQKARKEKKYINYKKNAKYVWQQQGIIVSHPG